MFIFWDLKNAFDKVPRPAMWAVLARLDVQKTSSPRFVLSMMAWLVEFVTKALFQTLFQLPEVSSKDVSWPQPAFHYMRLQC